MLHLKQANLTFATALVCLAVLLSACSHRLASKVLLVCYINRAGYLKVEIRFQVACLFSDSLLRSSTALFAGAGLAFDFGLGGLSWLAVFAAAGFLSRSSGGFGLVFGGRFAGRGLAAGSSFCFGGFPFGGRFFAFAGQAAAADEHEVDFAGIQVGTGYLNHNLVAHAEPQAAAFAFNAHGFGAVVEVVFAQLTDVNEAFDVDVVEGDEQAEAGHAVLSQFSTSRLASSARRSH